MRNPTELMKQILTDETAKRIIDFISPIYGNGYVALWIIQAIGTALSEICTISDELRNETNPMSSTILLDYWERHYNLLPEKDLPAEQRRYRIVSRIQNRGACTPAKLAAAVSAALNGVKVDIAENAERNTFYVNIRENVPSFEGVAAMIERMKPAHLRCVVRVELEATPTANLKTAATLTFAENYNLPIGGDNE